MTPGATEMASHRAVYHAELRPLLRQRLQLSAVIFVVLVGLSVVSELLAHPTRRHALFVVYSAEVVACLLGVVACRTRRLYEHLTLVGSLFGATLAALLSFYAYLSGIPGEILAMTHLCLLSGFFVVVPWGWRPQLGMAISAALSYAAVSPPVSTGDSQMMIGLAVLSGIVTSVLGAHFLDRYRFDAFVRASLLTQASAATQEEAQVNAALLRITEVLQVHLEHPDEMMQEMNRLAVPMLGCDWSSILLWDETRQSLRMRVSGGAKSDLQLLLADMEVTAEAFPAIQLFRTQEMLEIADVEQQSLAPPEFLQRAGVAALLSVALRRGEAFTGIFVVGRRERAGAFTPRQRRLAAGIAHATAIALDTTRLIAALQSANRLKSEFVSTVSHELRTPLNVILGYADMARDPIVPDTERLRCLEQINGAGRELLALIESTLETGRLEAGRSSVQLVPVVLSEFWQTLGEGCRTIPRHEDVRLEWADHVPARTVATDPHKLSIVVRNLVGNACKFTDRGAVRAELVAEPDGLVVRVQDTGIGIRPEDQGTIFEMFRQADGSDTRRFGGTGLGLYLVRQFVGQLGGAVTVESQVGVGSVFTVRVPVAPA